MLTIEERIGQALATPCGCGTRCGVRPNCVDPAIVFEQTNGARLPWIPRCARHRTLSRPARPVGGAQKVADCPRCLPQRIAAAFKEFVPAECAGEFAARLAGVR